MTELETKTETEAEDFADELSDDALDRAEGGKLSHAGSLTLNASR
jgi:hypothetical protein